MTYQMTPREEEQSIFDEPEPPPMPTGTTEGEMSVPEPLVSEEAQSRYPENFSEEDIEFAQRQAAYRAKHGGASPRVVPAIGRPASGRDPMHTPRFLQMQALHRQRKWPELRAMGMTVEEAEQLGVIERKLQGRRTINIPARNPAWIPRQKTTTFAPVESEETAKAREEAARARTEAEISQSHYDMAVADEQAQVARQQAEQIRQANERAEAARRANLEEQKRTNEASDAQLKAIEDGSMRPQNLFGSMGRFGDFMAKVFMLFARPEDTLQAARDEVARQETESRIRDTHHSNLVATLKSTDAASAQQTAEILTAGKARLEAAAAATKSPRIKLQIEAKLAALDEAILAAKAEREKALQGTVVGTEVFDPGSPGGSMRVGPTEAEIAGEMAKGIAISSAAETLTPEQRARQVWLPDEEVPGYASGPELTKTFTLAANAAWEFKQAMDEVYQQQKELRGLDPHSDRARALASSLNQNLLDLQAKKRKALDMGTPTGNETEQLEAAGPEQFQSYASRKLRTNAAFEAFYAQNRTNANRIYQRIKHGLTRDPMGRDRFVTDPSEMRKPKVVR